VRENTEGLYAGAGGTLRKGTKNEVAIQESITRAWASSAACGTIPITPQTQPRKETQLAKTNVLTFRVRSLGRAFNESAWNILILRPIRGTWTPPYVDGEEIRNGST